MYSKRNGRLTLALALAFGIGDPATAQSRPAGTIILIGPPGSGKTVQAEFLRKAYKIPAVSMSQLLHEGINRLSPMGKGLAVLTESGEFLADGPANELMKTRLQRPDVARGFILDGYPASEGQAKALDEWLHEHKMPKPILIVLNVPEAVSRERMIRRRRAGDEPANIERRLADYREVGRLVENWYGSERVVRVDGTGTPADVAARISKGIGDMQSRQGLKVRTGEDASLKRREPGGPIPEQKQ